MAGRHQGDAVLTGLGELDDVTRPHGAEPQHGGRVTLVDDEIDGDLPPFGVGRGDRVDAGSGHGGIGNPVELGRLEGKLDAYGDVGDAPALRPLRRPRLRIRIRIRIIVPIEDSVHARHMRGAALDAGDPPSHRLVRLPVGGSPVIRGVAGVILEKAEKLRSLSPVALGRPIVLARSVELLGSIRLCRLCHAGPPLC